MGENERQDIVPNFEHTATIRASPDAEDIFTVAHAKYSATDILVCITKLVADKRKKKILPVAVCDTFFHPNDPFTPLSVDFVLPYRTNILLEKVIVGHHREG